MNGSSGGAHTVARQSVSMRKPVIRRRAIGVAATPK